MRKSAGLSHDGDTSASGGPGTLFIGSAVILAWVLLALAWTPPTILVERAMAHESLGSAQVFLYVLTGFVPWMAATPLILRLALMFPVSRAGFFGPLAAHTAAGMVLIPLVTLAGKLLAAAAVGPAPPTASGLLLPVLISTFYNIPIYVAVAAIGQGFARAARGRPGAASETEASPRVYSRRLAIREKGRTEVIDTHDIDYVDVAGHYLCVHVGGVVHVTRGQIGNLQERLDPREFVRVHRSSLVRLDRVKAFAERHNGDCDVILADGSRVLLSRTYRETVRERLDLRDL